MILGVWGNIFQIGNVSCWSHTAGFMAQVLLKAAPETRRVFWEKIPWDRSEGLHQCVLLSWTLLDSLFFFFLSSLKEGILSGAFSKCILKPSTLEMKGKHLLIGCSPTLIYFSRQYIFSDPRGSPILVSEKS